MKRKTLIYLITLPLLAGLIVACNHEEENYLTDSKNEGKTVLAARRMHIITRAGDEVEQFAPGTRYVLFCAENTDTPWENAILYNRVGTEQDNHTIGYGTAITFGNTPVNFYGMTYGTSSEIPDTSSYKRLTEPIITEKIRDNGTLPDLMFSNNLQARTPDGGYRLEMDFKHAMSKIKFRITKQDESKDEDKKLENVTLKKITLHGIHTEGSLNLVKGTWDYTNNDTTSRIAYDGTQKNFPIEVTSEEVPGEWLIFPNQKDEEISIGVTLSGMTPANRDTTVIYALHNIDEEGSSQGNFRFAMNHQYTLLITVLKDDVRTIAIAPQVYDWVDIEQDSYLGQPVVFANLMWMDRNLGAKSADCENDWENCRGFYYQYGRNIPYILDMSKYDVAIKGDSNYPFLYTFNEYGDTIRGGVTARMTFNGIPVRYPYVAINPGDTATIYQFVTDQNNGGIWLYDSTGNNEYSGVNQLWTSSPDNHPCPKGWRIPTKEDFATFMPEINLGTYWTQGYHYKNNYKGNILNYQESSVYGTIDGKRVMYIIKRQGRQDCYRIRILMKESVSAPEKYYFEIAYFSGDATMTFEGLNSEQNFLASMVENGGRFDWSTPSAIMEIPACGFIHPSTVHKLDGDGINAILRTTDHNGANHNWVFYLREGNYQCGLINASRKALGDQIRCVRDVTINP